jgi:hypothetical protein
MVRVRSSIGCLEVIYNDRKRGWYTHEHRREFFRLMKSKSVCNPFTLCKKNVSKPIKVMIEGDERKYKVSIVERSLDEPRELKLLTPMKECGCTRPRFFHFYKHRENEKMKYSVATTCEEGSRAKGPLYHITLTLVSS